MFFVESALLKVAIGKSSSKGTGSPSVLSICKRTAVNGWLSLFFAIKKMQKSGKRRVAFVASCGIADNQRNRTQIRCGNNVASCGISPTCPCVLYYSVAFYLWLQEMINIVVSDFQSIIVFATDVTNATRVICGIIDFCWGWCRILLCQQITLGWCC